MANFNNTIHNYSPGASDGRFLWEKYLKEPYLYPPQADFSQLIREVSYGLLEIAGAKGRVILSTCSGTGALECAIAGLPPSYRILVMRNGYFGDRLWKIACLHFKDTVDYSIPYGESLTEANEGQLRDLIEKIEPNAVLCVHCETSSAAMNDIRIVGKICAKRRIVTIADGISALGTTAVDLNLWGIDCYVSAAHKALMGLPGLSFLVTNDRYLQVPDRKWSLYFDVQNLAEKSGNSQYLWSPNLLNLYAVRDTVREILSIGKIRYYRELQGKALRFRKTLTDGGLELVGSAEKQSSCFTAIVLKKPCADDIMKYLYNKYGIVIGKGIGYDIESTLRIGHHPYRTEEELDWLAKTVIEAAGECGAVK